MAAPRASWSLTSHLIETQQPLYKSATQHPFLLAGAEGRLDKETLSRWLANDRLYIHSYIRAAGKLLATLDLPREVSGSQEALETQLADWLIESLVAVRKEERFFLDVADRYGLGIEIGIPLVSTHGGASKDGDDNQGGSNRELPGLGMMQSVFASVSTVPITAPPDPDSVHPAPASISATAATPPPPLPWLEGALTFWGTERCYLDAWSWAKDKARECSAPSGKDADGGALRKEFIPNWSSPEFARFVDRLESLIDSAVGEVLNGCAEGEEREKAKEDILARVEGRWRTLLVAERAFWPEV
ncbi:putative bifunctional TENA-E protein [Madurella mycetomatis]|uniref:Bifunctional TENA-E protein n=1 Tax=Madurella mycetomatis TaxID=100816 RepID=A0A175VVB7_9PEZI|nr:putative bifunctional TENA-E protein [Madurella mycetomatis]